MRLASYNVENLFLRARALNQDVYAEGTPALRAQKRLNELFAKAQYSDADKKKILELLKELGLDKKDDGGEFAILRQNRGKLLKRPKTGKVQVVANGRADWTGWVDLKREEVNEVATQATAGVVVEVDADVLAVIEAESRPALLRFSDNLLPAAGGTPTTRSCSSTATTDRGIDVGIMTRGRNKLTTIESHVDDRANGERIFSRDCPVYTLTTARGNELMVLVNHFKSKIMGGDAKRKRQAPHVKKIYQRLVNEEHTRTAVVGDLNDTPNSAALGPLLRGTALRDISEHPSFDDGAGGERPGTFGSGTASQKIDYMLLSPELFDAVTAGGVFRMGVWAGKNGMIFSHYPEITRASQAASDHAAIWADVDV